MEEDRTNEVRQWDNFLFKSHKLSRVQEENDKREAVCTRLLPYLSDKVPMIGENMTIDMKSI